MECEGSMEIMEIGNFGMGEKEYRNYIKNWILGIDDEICFWDEYFRLKSYSGKEGYKKATVYAHHFRYEQDLENEKEYWLDVGSGPLSSCGSETQKADLHLVAVDPLANIYSAIKAKYKVNTKIKPKYCMVERLGESFSANMFDVVHMRNSLDHSYNPILGIAQLIYVCKLGGRIILRHYDNVAKNEKYNGMHQWNLVTDNDSFFIWRKDKKFDIGKVFEKNIDIELIEQSLETGLAFHTVVLRKKMDIQLVDDPTKYILEEELFSWMLRNKLESFYKKRRGLYKIL